ncbi:Hypothetical protein A7982_08849 [Minicystis rosea]|nr:Hypothetical protein A7982_08849 [Minicystis rosea]
MSLGDLAVIYLVAGVASAVAIYRTSTDRGAARMLSAAVAVILWPLWAPIALTSAKRLPAPARVVPGARPEAPVAAAADRIASALREGVEACAGTSLEALLPRDAAERMLAEVRRAAERHAELGALLAREGFDLAAAEARLAELTESNASPRAISTARLHLDNVRRIAAMRERDARALDELGDVVQALRAQLVIARLSGPQPEGAGGIVSELWARVEGLGVALGTDEVPPAHAEVA